MDDPDGCHVALTEEPLDVAATLDLVRSPKAGANVLFSGTTRDNFDGHQVHSLCYSAYRPLALQSLRAIARSIRDQHGALSVAIVHRLGPVPIGEDSILIAVSAPHRQAAWRAGEACLEAVKARAEIWKREDFVGEAGVSGGEGLDGQKVWRSNADAKAGWVAAADAYGKKLME